MLRPRHVVNNSVRELNAGVLVFRHGKRCPLVLMMTHINRSNTALEQTKCKFYSCH